MSAAMRAQARAVGRHRARSLIRESGLVAGRAKKRHSYLVGEVSRIAENHLDRHKTLINLTKNGSVRQSTFDGSLKFRLGRLASHC